MAISLDTAPETRPLRRWNPNLIVRVLAVIGAILLVERAATAWQWSSKAEHKFSIIGNIGTLSWEAAEEPEHYHDEAPPPPSVDAFTSKTIVVASIKKENASWIQENFRDLGWNIVQYVVDDKKANHTVLRNQGNEASVILTYLIHHYSDLSDVTLFSHSERYQWHNDHPMYDGVPAIRDLRLDYVQREGYVSLRADHNPGCLSDHESVHPDTEKEDDFFGYDHMYADIFTKLFPKKPLPKEVSTGCCAQFAVSREAVHQRPISFYEKARLILWNEEAFAFKSGRVYEYLWHIMFGKPAIHCPSAKKQYCLAWGLCDLDCPDDDSCRGLYQRPPWDQEIDPAWPNPAGHRDGWPDDGWWERFLPSDKYDESFRLRENPTTPEQAYPEEFESPTEAADAASELASELASGPADETQ